MFVAARPIGTDGAVVSGFETVTVIAVDGQGNIAMPFNTEGMYRGFARPGQDPVVEIYRA